MSLDPLGHITISVSDFAKSRKFYGELFDFLGYKVVSDNSNSTGWASPTGFGFWLKPAEIANHSYKFGAPFVSRPRARRRLTGCIRNLSSQIISVCLTPPRPIRNTRQIITPSFSRIWMG